MASDTEEEYALRKELQNQAFEKRIQARMKGATAVAEKEISQKTPTPSEQPNSEIDTGPFSGISDEELHKAFDRGENTWETSVGGIPTNVAEISAELGRRNRLSEAIVSPVGSQEPGVVQPELDLLPAQPQTMNQAIAELRARDEREKAG